MADTKNIHDFKHISCGLVPAMSRELSASTAQEVEFHIKQGIKLEIVSSFGTDPTWELCHETHLGMDIARFTRRIQKDPTSELNIVDY
jgi:hypothetical protein